MNTSSVFMLVAAFLFVIPQTATGQLIGWDFAGFAGNEESVVATTLDPFLQPSIIIRGDGINPSSLVNSFNSSGFTAGGTFDDAVENDEFIEFSIGALPGYTVSLSILDTRFRRSGTGPDRFLWQYSLDNFATPGAAIGDTIIYEESVPEGHDQDILDLSGISELQEVGSGTVITIRLYGWGASAGGGTFAIGRRSGNDLEIGGTIGFPPGPHIVHIPLGDTDSNEDRTATADITGNDLITEGVNRPVLWYSIDDGTSWTETYYTDLIGDTFEFSIPGQPVDTEVLYYIAAMDADAVLTNPFGGSGDNPPGSTPPETFHSYTIFEPGPDVAFILTSDPGDTSEDNRVLFPYAGMGSEEGDIGFFGNDDWTYIDPQFTFYAVVEGNTQIIAAEFFIEWDYEIGDLIIEEGNLFLNDHSVFQAMPVGDGRLRVNASSLQGNVTPFEGSYIARITVTATSPGFNEVTVTDVDLRYYDELEDMQVVVAAEAFPGQIKFYLGDFGKMENDTPVGDSGDGVIDFNDLLLFAGAYWSERNDGFYRTKYDIGPTDGSGSYFAMPSPDGVIDFEDLVIFAIGYYRSADGLLPKHMLSPLRIVVHEIQEEENSVIVPLGFEGEVDDVRAISLELGVPVSALTFTQAIPTGELDQEMGFLASRKLDGRIHLDAAVVRSAFSQEGVFVYLHFDRHDSFDPGSVGFVSAIARNSYNMDIPLELSHYLEDSNPGIPVRYALSQNYPNPFNPVTTIEYQLPEDAHVHIVVYNVLGEKVAELVREYQESGYHSVTWNGLNLHNIPAPSGMYIYRMKAGEYIGVKRMILIK